MQSKDKISYFAFVGIKDLKSFANNLKSNQINDYPIKLLDNKFDEFHFIPPNEILSNNGAVLIFSLLFTYPSQYKDNDGNVKDLWDYLLTNRQLSMKHEWRAELAFRFSRFFGRMGVPDPLDRKATKEWIKGKIQSLRDESEE